MNISKEKREKLIEYLEKLKENKEDEDIRIIQEIEKALNEKKYGLVWEEHSEKVDEELKTKIPVFKEIEERKIEKDKSKPYNFLLEGDNLHSLKLLQKTHKGKIDVIYIDPPYNTGNKDFIYNDNYVGTEDGYRHSKWLSFMEKRLRIAKELLTDEGVIFISIDDNEQAQLKLLCDEVFGGENFVSLMPRVTKKAGKNHGSNISKNNDFVLIYMKKNYDLFKGIIPDASKYPFKDEYYEKRGSYKLNQTLDYNSLWYNPKMDFEVEIDGKKFIPGSDYAKHLQRHKGIHDSKDWVWRWSKAKIEFGQKNNFIVIKNNRIYTKTYLNVNITKKNNEYFIEEKDRYQKYSSLYFVDNIFSNDNAKKDLFKILENSNIFEFSKPISLIYAILQMVDNKNSTILDFFAGSGTTGHAVMQLNKEDGGNRRYILCTNNENKICEEVTYKRLMNIQEELPHNLKYFKTDFISKFSEDEIIPQMMLHIKEMIELEYGIEIDGKNCDIIYSEEELDEKIENISNLGRIFMVTGIFMNEKQQKLLADKNVEIIEIPEYYFKEELKEMGEI